MAVDSFSRSLARPIARAASTAPRAHTLCVRATILPLHASAAGARHYSASAPRRKEVFAERPTAQIRLSPPAWAHPVYTEDQMSALCRHLLSVDFFVLC